MIHLSSIFFEYAKSSMPPHSKGCILLLYVMIGDRQISNSQTTLILVLISQVSVYQLKQHAQKLFEIHACLARNLLL